MVKEQIDEGDEAVFFSFGAWGKKLSLKKISEPTRLLSKPYAVFGWKKKKNRKKKQNMKDKNNKERAVGKIVAD